MIVTARPPKRTPKPKPKAPSLTRTVVTSKSPAEVKREKRIERLREDAVKR